MYILTSPSGEPAHLSVWTLEWMRKMYLWGKEDAEVILPTVAATLPGPAQAFAKVQSRVMFWGLHMLGAIARAKMEALRDRDVVRNVAGQNWQARAFGLIDHVVTTRQAAAAAPDARL